MEKAHGCKNPDECYIDKESKNMFIIEKKFQQCSGSVCEKIQTPHFKKWQYSLGAVLAVFHDVMILLSIFSLFYGLLPFSLEIDQAFIAAVLTVIGYSLNDTVVVFDRIREYLAVKVGDSSDVINRALNSTLSRTINTSLTTFFVLLVIFIFGGEIIRGFMFAIMTGVIVGTYSSLFIASPIMYDSTK